MVHAIGAERAPDIHFDLELVWPEEGSVTLNGLAAEAELLTLDALTSQGLVALMDLARQPEGQAEDESSKTFNHCRYVGGLSLGVLRELSRFRVDELNHIEDVAAVAGTLHDFGKRRPEVRELIVLPRTLSADERATVGWHTVYGQQDIKEYVEDSRLNRIAAAVALGHHKPYEFDASLARNPVDTMQLREEAEYTGLIRVVDKCQAVFLDWSRDYKAVRLQKEGIITDNGELNVEKAAEAVMGDDAQRAYFGVKTTEIVDYTRQFMPSPEEIREVIARQQENSQKYQQANS